eukprot:TRINITY_DN4697_c0_g2_i2.p1 TRINITY_DN4697_c0_g2~~TRINITY_DN4697_c0_g2_i2.p1  ORF type:complete len:677 (+),score=54.26 TRINITY_DN4697_c0_g2_i2:58-2088(+)
MEPGPEPATNAAEPATADEAAEDPVPLFTKPRCVTNGTEMSIDLMSMRDRRASVEPSPRDGEIRRALSEVRRGSDAFSHSPVRQLSLDECSRDGPQRVSSAIFHAGNAPRKATKEACPEKDLVGKEPSESSSDDSRVIKGSLETCSENVSASHIQGARGLASVISDEHYLHIPDNLQRPPDSISQLGLEPPHYLDSTEGYILPAPDGSIVSLKALDTLRLIASIHLVLYNFYRGDNSFLEGKYAAWFPMWNQFIFMLSGFLLAYVEMVTPPDPRTSFNTLRYMRRRLTAIYPVYVLSLVVSMVVAAHNSGRLASEWPQLCLHLILLQSWFPTCVQSSSGISCIPDIPYKDAWFLSIMVQYWVILRPLANFYKRRSYGACVRSILACWSLAFALQWAEKNDAWAVKIGCEKNSTYCSILIAKFCSSPLGYVHVFVSGVVAARIFILKTTKQTTDARSRSAIWSNSRVGTVPLEMKFGCCIGFAIYFFFLFVATDAVQRRYYFFHHGGMIPVMLLILLGSVLGQDPLCAVFFRCKPIAALGRTSYILLLIQHLVWKWLAKTFGWEKNEHAKWSFVPLLLLCSYLCYRYVERPFTQYQLLRQEKGIRGWDDRVLDALDSLMLRAWCRWCCLLIPILIIAPAFVVLSDPSHIPEAPFKWPFDDTLMKKLNVSAASFNVHT